MTHTPAPRSSAPFGLVDEASPAPVWTPSGATPVEGFEPAVAPSVVTPSPVPSPAGAEEAPAGRPKSERARAREAAARAKAEEKDRATREKAAAERARADEKAEAERARADAKAQAANAKAEALAAKRDAADAKKEAKANRPDFIGIPRAASWLGALLTFGAVTSSVLVATRPEFAGSHQLPVALPLLVGLAAAGVARLPGWVNQVLVDWGRPFAIAAFAPYLLLVFAVLATRHLELPCWVGPAVGAWAALPFVYSATARRRLRPPLAPEPDAYGRRGVLIAAGALAVTAYSIARPDFGSFVQVLLAIALVVAAFLGRGMADAAKTWPTPAWVALVWGAAVVWASVLIEPVRHLLDGAVGALGAVLLAAVPLALVALSSRRSAA